MKKAALFFLAMVFSIVLSAQIRMNAWVMPDTSTNFPMNVPIYTLVYVLSNDSLYSVNSSYLGTDNMHDVITDGNYIAYPGGGGLGGDTSYFDFASQRITTKTGVTSIKSDTGLYSVVGIGTLTPGGIFDVTGLATNYNTYFRNYSATQADRPRLNLVKYDGTTASYTAVDDGEYLGEINIGGSTSAIAENFAFSLQLKATENWASGVKRGSEAYFKHSPNGLASQETRMLFDSLGNIVFNGDLLPSADCGGNAGSKALRWDTAYICGRLDGGSGAFSIGGTTATDSVIIDSKIFFESDVSFSNTLPLLDSDTVLVMSNDSMGYSVAFDTSFFSFSTPTLSGKSAISSFKSSTDTITVFTNAFAWGGLNAVRINTGYVMGRICIVDTNAHYSFAHGLRAKTTMYGQVAQASGWFAEQGDAQTSVVTIRKSVLHEDDAIYPLSLDSYYTSNHYIYLYPSTAYKFTVDLQGITQNSAQIFNYTITGCIKRDNANNTTLVWSTVVENYEDDADFVATVTADDTLEILEIAVQDAGVTPSDYTVRWVARVELTETVFP